jgi:hypothetical protein
MTTAGNATDDLEAPAHARLTHVHATANRAAAVCAILRGTMSNVPIRTQTTLLLLLLALACGEPARRKPADKHTNLLLVTLDTLRADRLGCYGYEQGSMPA